jgi:hypothetical protein
MRFRLLLVCAVLTLFGCSVVEDFREAREAQEGSGSGSGTPASGFAYGLDYARPDGWEGIPDPAALYSETGANWVKIAGIPWSMIQPKENGPYQWGVLDNLVRSYQQYDFDILAVLVCDSPWATEMSHPNVKLGGRVSSPPKDGYWRYYARWVAALVERYDADGINDMPGLRKPFSTFEIESEAQSEIYWKVPKDKNRVLEYAKLLKIAYDAAHQANPDALVILSGFNLGDYFDDGVPKTDQELIRYVQKAYHDRPGMKVLAGMSLPFIKGSLKLHNWFDAVEFHYNHDYRAAYATTQWIRGTMAEYGYSKPIWAGDCLIANAIVIDSKNHIEPLPLGNRMFQALEDKGSDFHRKAWTWHMEEQASNLVKKILVAMDTGLKGIMAANEADWPQWRGSGNFWVYAGFYGQESEQTPASVKGRRPVFYTYKLAVDTIGSNPKSVERLSIGDRWTHFAFRVVREDGKVVFVAWHEAPSKWDGIKHARTLQEFFAAVGNDPQETIDLSPYASAPTARLVHIVSRLEPDGTPIRAEGSHPANRIPISNVPVFIWLE